MKKTYFIAVIFCAMAIFSLVDIRHVSADDQADCTTYCTGLGKTGADLQACVNKCIADKKGGGGSVSTTTFDNPLRFNTIEAVLTSVMDNLRGILATIAIIFIILGGIMYMLSAGDEKMITRAKERKS